MRTQLGFELRGSFTMPSSEPPGLEGGHTILVRFGAHTVPCVVTKVVTDGDERRVEFYTPPVTSIDVEAPS